MSPAAQARPVLSPAPLRFTREEYQRMAEIGLFEGRRVELLDGEIIEMTPQGSRHASAIASIVEKLVRALSPSFSVRPQLPIALDSHSEPEPDVAVCQPDPRNYADEHPGSARVLLLVEISDSSFAYDRDRKAGAYARAGVPLLWIVDLRARVVIVLSEPDRQLAVYRREERVQEDAGLVLPGGSTVRVAEILPPP